MRQGLGRRGRRNAISSRGRGSHPEKGARCRCRADWLHCLATSARAGGMRGGKGLVVELSQHDSLPIPAEDPFLLRSDPYSSTPREALGPSVHPSHCCLWFSSYGGWGEKVITRNAPPNESSLAGGRACITLTFEEENVFVCASSRES